MGFLDTIRSIFSQDFDNRDEFSDGIEVIEAVGTKAALKSSKHLLEGLSDYDPDENLTVVQGGSRGFKPLSKRVNRDLPTFKHDEGQKLAYNLYISNPLAKRAVEIIADYIVGTETKYSVTEPDESVASEMRDVLDVFWNDPVNLLDVKLYKKVLELLVYGEGFYTAFVNPIDGHVRLGYIDPELVSAVLPNAENPEIIEAIKVKAFDATGRSMYEYYKVIGIDEDPTSDSFGYRMGTYTKPGEDYDERDNIQITDVNTIGVISTKTVKTVGGVFQFSVNRVTSAQRGQSMLMTLLDWLDAYDNLLYGEVDRMQLLRNIIWDVMIEGADEAELEKFIKQNPPPPPGTVKVHNEKVTWTAVVPELQNGDMKQGVDSILSHIATGAGQPKTWLNSVLDSNRATSTELGEPTFKHLSTLQALVRHIVTEILSFQLDQAALVGRIKKREPRKRWAYRIQLPELRPKDLKLAADTLLVAAQGMEFALDHGTLDINSAQRMNVLLMAGLGLEVNLEEMQKNIEEDKKLQLQAEEAKLKMQQEFAPKPTVPGQPGAGGRLNGAKGKVVQPRTASAMSSRVNPQGSPPKSQKAK